MFVCGSNNNKEKKFNRILVKREHRNRMKHASKEVQCQKITKMIKLNEYSFV